MKLNIGGGRTKYDGFLNCDYDVNANPDFVFNLETDIWPFEDNSVDEVMAHHIFEHLGEGYFHMLKELYRVCKDGAVIDIRVPHHRHDCFHHDPTHRRAITPYGINLFNKQVNYYEENASSKLGILYDVDFRVIDYNYTFDHHYCNNEELKNKTVHEIEEYAYTKSNVLLETLITVVVCKSEPSERELKIRSVFETILNRKMNYDECMKYLVSNMTVDDIKNELLQCPEYKNLNGLL